MRCVKTAVYYAIGPVLCMFLLVGCGSNQLTSCQREKQEMQETIKAQQEQIDDLTHRAKTMDDIILQVTTQLEERKGLRPKAEGEKKQNPKIAKRLERKRVPRTRTNPKPRPKTSTIKKKRGCACKRKRSK
jgi:hypothetical protein